jgi:hypothetical protein
MLKKIVTTVGLVSVFGASATQAIQNLSSATAVIPTYYATETIGPLDVTAGSGANTGTTFFDIDDAGNLLDVSLVTGFVGAPTLGDDYYIKVELTNAAFNITSGAIAVQENGAGGLDIGSAALFSGGAAGSSQAIYEFDISGAMQATTTVTLDIASLGTNGDPIVKMSIFETLTEANKATGGTPVSTGSQTIASFRDGNKVTIAAAPETAEVSQGFLKYLNGTGPTVGLVGELGATTFGFVASTVAADDGGQVATTDLYTGTTSIATITGDLSNGTWYYDAAGCGAALAPPTAQKLTLNAAKTSGTATVATITSKSTLCNVVGGVVAIPASSYLLSIAYTAGTAGVGASADVGVSVGSVTRNGTDQNINYLTTFKDYNQRVYITNRGTTDATYAFTFQSEDGTTATAGTAATGTSKAASVLALKAADIVTLTGKTRTAASLAIVGTPSLFSISTQQVNLSNGATDTVIYKE